MSSRPEAAADRSVEEELAEARRRIAELQALAGAAELLDPSLDFPGLARRALELALRVVPADAALLVAHGADGLKSTTLLRGEDRLRGTGEFASQLAREVLASGEEGIRRGAESPGARAMAEILGEIPAVRIAVPLHRAERVLGVLEVAYRREPDARFLERSAALRSVADHLAIVLDHSRVVRALARRARHLERLHDVGRRMSAHGELDDVLEAIVDAVRELIPADAVGIFLIDEETGEFRNTTFRGYDACVADVRLKAGGGIIGWVARTAQGIIVPDVARDDRYIEVRRTTRSEMAAPIQYENRVIGIFNLENDRENAYTPAQLEVLTGFGNQAAVSIVNARLHEEVTEKRLLEQQLEIARGIQTSLLPRSAPEIPGHCLVGRNLPSESVGGDYFDFVPLPGGRWAIIVADASGHGIAAGLVMAGFRAEVRAGLRHHDEPRGVLAEVNKTLCGELAPDFFVTAFLGVYSPESGRFVYTNAGHEPGLVVRQGGVDLLAEGGLI
ncbi:MAG: GAF domain-containing protein, partial [bacterium]